MLKWHRYREINLSNKVITMLVWRQCPSSEAHCCTDVSRYASPCFQQLRWKKGSGFLPWVIRRASFYLGLCSVLSTPGHHLCSDFLKRFYVNSSLVFLSKCFLKEYSCVSTGNDWPVPTRQFPTEKIWKQTHVSNNAAASCIQIIVCSFIHFSPTHIYQLPSLYSGHVAVSQTVHIPTFTKAIFSFSWPCLRHVEIPGIEPMPQQWATSVTTADL